MALPALNEIAETICRAAGWLSRPVGETGRLTFTLADGLFFEILKPDESHLAFRADLSDHRPEDEAEAAELARRLGLMAAAAFTKRLSVLSLEDNRFRLHRVVDLKTVGLDELPALCAAFLNDLDWWRKNFPDQVTPDELPGRFFPAGLRL